MDQRNFTLLQVNQEDCWATTKICSQINGIRMVYQETFLDGLDASTSTTSSGGFNSRDFSVTGNIPVQATTENQYWAKMAKIPNSFSIFSSNAEISCLSRHKLWNAVAWISLVFNSVGHPVCYLSVVPLSTWPVCQKSSCPHCFQPCLTAWTCAPVATVLLRTDARSWMAQENKARSGHLAAYSTIPFPAHLMCNSRRDHRLEF